MADKSDDVDALLASLENTSKEESKSDGTSGNFDLEGFGSREGTFRIDSRNASSAGVDKLRSDADSLSVNPEDFVNRAEKATASRRTRVILAALGGLIFLMGLGWAAVSLIESTTAPVVNELPAEQTEEQRFLSLFPDAPAPDVSRPTVGLVEPNGVYNPGGYGLTFPGMEFESLNFEAIKTTSFGPAALATVEGEWNGTTVYLFKDMAHSKAFADAWAGAPTTVEGSPASAVMLMELPTGVHVVLAIVNPDSTGYMIVLPQNLNYESAENLQHFVRIEPSPISTP